MKKLNRKEIDEAFSMPYLRREHWEYLPKVFELKAHGLVTLDMQPSFAKIAPSYKAATALTERHNLAIFRIDKASGKKTKEYVNPLY